MTLQRSPCGLWHSPLLESQTWLSHAFGTAGAAPPDGYLLLHQIHGTRLIDAAEWHPRISADAIATADPAVRVAVKTADCVPILIADPVRRVVAAIHAGWRGTVDGIAGLSVEALANRHGSRPGDLLAAFGPSIGPCCFEVGPDVAPLFQRLFPDRHDLASPTRVDLREANRRILLAAGLSASNIAYHAPCTHCGGAEFHSWRRDRAPGKRMFAVIEIRPGP